MGPTIMSKPASSSREKFLGGQRAVQGKTEYIYAYVPANTVKGEVLVLKHDGDEESNPKAVQVATETTVYQHVVVASENQGASAGFQWCAIRGEVDALVNGTTDVAKDDYLEVINSTDNFVKDGASRTVNSVAIAREAYTDSSDALKKVYLLGDRVNIAAS